MDQSMNYNKTQSQNHFATTLHPQLQVSTMNRNSTHKHTFNAGELVPVYLDEVLPGDTFEVDLAHITRMSTLLVPVMDTAHIDFYAFFVPNRIVWDGWEELCGENKTGDWAPAEDPALVPQFTDGVITAGSLADYLGLPLLPLSEDVSISALPFRMYALIWNEWFRDQNTTAPIPLYKGDADNQNVDDVNDLLFGPGSKLLKAFKERDYFTSCLPGPQKGDAVFVPLTLDSVLPIYNNGVPVVINGVAPNGGATPIESKLNFDGANSVSWQSPQSISPFNNSNLVALPQTPEGEAVQLTNVTINDLRDAWQIQKLFEKDARGGTRYIEMLKAHFGVDAQDYRLQRPELLGHIRHSLSVTQVAQTSASTEGDVGETTPQANLSAYSDTRGAGHIFKKSFVEHGCVIIVACVRQNKTYQQGIPKLFSRRERFDFYYPTLAHISEQPVLNKEIYATTNKENNEEVFGYNEAWAEYRYKPNSVHGQFRNNAPNNLSIWTFADFYDNVPMLNRAFMEENSQENIDEALAVSSFNDGVNQFIMNLGVCNKSTRQMPVHGIPGLVDHF